MPIYHAINDVENRLRLGGEGGSAETAASGMSSADAGHKCES